MEISAGPYVVDEYLVSDVARLHVNTDSDDLGITIHVGINQGFEAKNPWPDESTDFSWYENIYDGMVNDDSVCLETGINECFHSKTVFEKPIGSSVQKLHRRTIEENILSRYSLAYLASTSGCDKVVLENPGPGTIKRLTDNNEMNIPIELIRSKNETDAQWQDYVLRLTSILQELGWQSSLTDKVKTYRADVFYYCGFHSPRRPRGRLKHWMWYEVNLGTLLYNQGSIVDVQRNANGVSYSVVKRTKEQEYYTEGDSWLWGDRKTRYHYDLLRSQWDGTYKYSHWGYYGINTTSDIGVDHDLSVRDYGIVADSLLSYGDLRVTKKGIYSGDRKISGVYGPVGDQFDNWEAICAETGNYFSATCLWSPYYHSFLRLKKHYCVVKSEKGRNFGLLGRWKVVSFDKCTHVIRDNGKQQYGIIFDKSLGLPPYITDVCAFDIVVGASHFSPVVG